MILFPQDLSNAHLFWQKPREYVWEWILKELDQDGRHVILDWAECINMGALSRGPGFNILAQVGQEWL